MTTFNDLAPYPTSVAKATAEELCRNYAVLAQANLVRSHEGPTVEVRHAGTSMLLNVFSVVQLLRTFTELTSSGDADAAARELLGLLHAPHAIGPEIAEWLTEYGIDPEKVDEIARGASDMQPKPEMVSVRKDDLARYLNGDGSDLDAAVDGLNRLYKAAGIDR